MTSVPMDAAEPHKSAKRTKTTASSSSQQRWCIVTCEYPPIVGGVSDHTHLLVRALTAAGDTVDVWCPPAEDTEDAAPEIAGATVHVLPSRYGLGALGALRRMLHDLPSDTRVLVQWVPTAFGWRMMNLPFALLLFTRKGRTLDLYVHEVGWEISSRETTRRALAGVVHRVMTWLAARSARRVYVTIPAWEKRLHLLGVSALAKEQGVAWAPVPSNLPDRTDPSRVAEIRRELLKGARMNVVVGHFGTFGRWHSALMPHAVARILDEGADRVMLLVGRGGSALRDSIVAARPDLAKRLTATGGLSPEEASAHIAACDVLVQPYEDGVSARRGSLMAGLALGRPIIANRGFNTEELWAAERAIHLTDSAAPHALGGAITKLMADPALRARLSESAARLHAERFALARGVTLLRDAADLTIQTELA
jgi:glycosyltransferase involved in cell wall biosynthesis